MIKKYGFLSVLTCTVLFGVFMPFTAAGQDADSVADVRREKALLEKEIRTIESRISETDSIMQREQKRFAILQRRIAESIERKKSDSDTLNDKLDELTAEIQRLSGEIEQKRADTRAMQSRREYITSQLIERCENLRGQIHSSLPWNKEERLARVNALKSDLESGSARMEDGLSRLLALIDEETAFGDEIILDTRTIQRNDGSSVNARVMRIGNLWMAYVDASEQFYGVLHRENDTTFIWNEELDFTQREQIRTAIRVKESKKAPQIVSLPLTVKVNRKTEEN